ncbi:hypothetical protein GALMADRAFT_243691 [Galerina marginata CBS 339.88]|uniref:Uncharacterized protein n=1 Tax=Galerina marginata (strain CBS 339.88) TaxID=685588 RepID=A0A067TB66_GALM3|nr:hypothetical protein GALMADRAFT_243691 [Galerina marginata CBS 339.88]
MRGRNLLTGVAPTYQPFPPPPDLPVVPQPVKYGFFAYSSTGLTIMNYRPKRPSELLAAITEQYEEQKLDRFGRAVRGGPGKKKGKPFFQAHLIWYGLEFAGDDSRDELEAKLWDAMSARPLPTLPDETFKAEEEMREMWVNSAAVEHDRVLNLLLQQGHTVYTSETLAELTGADSLTDDFFDDPKKFFETHFPAGVSPQHVVVLMNVDEVAEIQVWEWACDAYGLRVEKVENDRGRGRDRGCFPDFVIGKNGRAVKQKADEIRQENGRGAASARFRPY